MSRAARLALTPRTPTRPRSIVIRRLVASVPGLRGCHTQARSLDELIARIREAIALCLEERGEPA
ncbi:MAG: type II toxin-antitoxin system HicB family antitoxin [Longimicrobiales bacterium]